MDRRTLLERRTLSSAAWLLGIAALGLGSAACNPLAFFDLRDEAPTALLEAPNDFVGEAFGTVLAPVVATDPGTGLMTSRVAVGGGPGSPFVYYPIALGAEFQLDISNLLRGCFPDDTCPGGIGPSLAGASRARFSGAAQSSCFLAPAPGQIQTWCESAAAYITWPAPTETGFGEAGAGLPDAHALGIALFSAPGEVSAEGRLFRVSEEGRPELIEPSSPIPELAAASRLGHRLALFAPDSQSALVAATAPSAPSGPTVYMLSLDTSLGPLEVSTRACVRLPGVASFGEALALGDLTGDGLPELLVGTGSEEGVSETVYLYDGADLPADAGADCSNTWPLAMELSCPEGSDAGCAGSAFGASLAVGDFNGDGVGDLLVGAPGATVDGVAGAGAAFVFAGSAAGLGELGGELGSESALLRHSAPEADDHLGAAVAAVRGPARGSAPRYEALAGAPGRRRVALFTCTGLRQDSAADFPSSYRCQPDE